MTSGLRSIKHDYIDYKTAWRDFQKRALSVEMFVCQIAWAVSGFHSWRMTLSGWQAIGHFLLVAKLAEAGEWLDLIRLHAAKEAQPWRSTASSNCNLLPVENNQLYSNNLKHGARHFQHTKCCPYGWVTAGVRWLNFNGTTSCHAHAWCAKECNHSPIFFPLFPSLVIFVRSTKEQES